MALVLDGSAGVSGVDGTASNPSYEGTDSNTGIFFPAADTVAIGTGGTERLRVDSSGNVGFGTSSPALPIDVVSNSSSLALSIRGRSSDDIGTLMYYTNNGVTNTAQIQMRPNDNEFRFAAIGARSHTFFTNGSERARITSGGNLLVGTTDTAQNTGVGIKLLINESGNNQDVVVTNQNSTSASACFTAYSTAASAYRFYVTMDGKINCTSTTIASISDIRLKENIQDLDVGLGAIMALKPRKFDWKEGKGKDIKGDRGWIAQEFEQVFPDMISTWRDEPPEGEEPYKAVGADLIPILVKAIQELNAKVEAQAAEIAALKGNA